MIEIRSSDDGENWTLSGLATTYDSPYPVRDRQGEYLESISRGAFSAAIGGREVVELRGEHQHDGPALAATGRSNTMQLTDSAEGLVLRATLPKADPDCQAAVSKAQRGLLDRMSIGFRDIASDWSNDRSRRTVRSAALAEVSLVHRPSNPAAKVMAVRRDELDSELEFRFGPEVTVIEGRTAKHTHTPNLRSLEEVELELRCIDFEAAQRRRGLARPLRRSRPVSGIDAEIARAVRASQCTELEIELLLANAKRR